MAVVHSYLRFSSVGQADGDSENRQLQNGADWVKRHGHQFSNLSLVDRARSSFKGDKQKALKEFLKAIDQGKVRPGEILLCEAIDRLSRKGIRQTQDLVNSILNRGVSIAILYPTEKIYKAEDSNDIGGAIELAAFAYQAWVYSENLSKRITSAAESLRQKARSGIKSRKTCPGWLTWNATRNDWDIRPGSKETITFIFKSVAEGMGERRLHRELTDKKIKPLARPGKRSGHWNTAFLARLLRDPAVCGVWQPVHGDAVPGYYPRIVSDELFLRAQAARKTRFLGRSPNGQFVNLFVGIVHNARDCHPMHIQTMMPQGHTYRRLVSYGKLQRLPGSDPMTLNYPGVEKAVLNFLREVKADDITPSDTVTTTVLATKRGELAGIEQQLGKLKKALVGGADFDTLRDAITTLEAKKAQVKREIAALEQQTAVSDTRPHDEAKSILDLLDSAEGEELRDLRLRLRAVLGNLIDSIWVLPFRVQRKGSRRARIAAHIQVTFRSGVYRSFTMSPYITKPVNVTIKANGKTINFQSAGGAAGAWETTNNPEMDLRNYRDKKLGVKLRKKLGV